MVWHVKITPRFFGSETLMQYVVLVKKRRFGFWKETKWCNNGFNSSLVIVAACKHPAEFDTIEQAVNEVYHSFHNYSDDIRIRVVLNKSDYFRYRRARKKCPKLIENRSS